MKQISKRKNGGSLLVEVVVGAAIVAIGLIAISTSYVTYVQYALANQKNVEASYLLEEGMEAMSFFRDKGWSANIFPLSTTTMYYLNWNGTQWATTTTPTYVDGLFLRSIKIFDVYRDANSDIAGSGTYDSNIKKISVSIDYWQGHATTTQSISAYIVNIYGN